jgi:hypothetical protein
MLIGSLSVSILYAFLYRLAAVCGLVEWIKRKRVLLAMALLQLCYGAPLPAIYLSNRPSQTEIAAYIAQVGSRNGWLEANNT